MKLRFLMSHGRKNSVRDKVIGKKWVYLERYTFHRHSVGHLRRRERPMPLYTRDLSVLGFWYLWRRPETNPLQILRDGCVIF